MVDIKAWAEYVVEWAAKDPYGFLTTVILALTPLFVITLSWKLAKMVEAREREQKKKQKRQENIAKAKRTKKD
ncbi:SIM15 protein, partial [Pedionomus torquatus]|nr:SIM15 protein [Pedionomus torquatus]